jgi:hypothetical protein
MVIPNKVKIGGITYDVVQMPAGEYLKPDGNVWGEIFYHKAAIFLESNVADEYKEQCFVHELIHGILNAMGRTDLRSDEQFVEPFSQVLYQVLKDNKLHFDE